MKSLWLITLAAGSIALGGCTTPARMNVVDLNYYTIDCAQQQEQLSFLRRQQPTQNERIIAAMHMTSVTGVLVAASDGTYYEHRASFDRRQDAIANMIIDQIHANCALVQTPPRLQSCITINESLPSGNSQGTRCYQQNTLSPVVNRWEALVDLE